MGPGEIVLRPILILLGAFAMVWGGLSFSPHWRQYSIEHVAGAILAGAHYNIEALDPVMPEVQAALKADRCEPQALRAAAVVLLHVVEQSYSTEQLPLLDQRVDDLDAAIRRSLGCAAADPFLWMVLFSIESARNGFRPEYLEYVRNSYDLGPHEGWIAVKRNRVVIAMFSRLPADIADMAIGEFAELVENQLYEPALDVLLGPGLAIRDRLLDRLAAVGRPQRVDFAVRIYAKGFDLAVPGIPAPGQRPWR